MVSTLYITEPGTSVHKVDERLVLRKEKKVIGDIPLINLRQVVVVGRGIDVSTEAMLILVERQIDLTFFSRNMRFRARVGGEVYLQGQLRLAQVRYVDNPARQLALAKVIVQGKLANQRRLLSRHAAQNPALASLAQRIGRVSETAVPDARDPDALRGYEGQGAALYFEGLRLLIPQVREWGFTRREYYPPPDPVNALLSFGYSLLTREVLAAVHLVGLDPYLGFFHVMDYGRPSLALDLVEEFRPVIVDGLVLDLLTQGKLTLADFEQVATTSPDPAQPEAVRRGGLRLKPAARQRFLQAYEERMAQYARYEPEGRQHTYRRTIELQARQLARLVMGETEQYLPVRG